jgi:hypothetical protein
VNNRIVHYGNAEAKRAEQSPSLQRQLDMLWRALGEVRASGVPFSRDVIDMLDRIEAVQQRYPYPPEGS